MSHGDLPSFLTTTPLPPKKDKKVEDIPDFLKKKEDTFAGGNISAEFGTSSGTATSPVEAKPTQSFAEKLGQRINDEVDKGTITPGDYKDPAIFGKRKATPKKNISKQDDFIGVDENTFYQPTVTMPDGTEYRLDVVATSVVGKNEQRKVAQDIQLRINNGQATDADIISISANTGKMPELVKAKLTNNKTDIEFYEFKNDENNINKEVIKQVAEGNKMFGFTDNVEEVLSSFDNAKTYLQKIKDAKKSRVKEITDLGGKFYDDAFIERTNILINKVDALAKQKEISKIAASPDLSLEEKREKARLVIAGDKIKQGQDAIVNRLTSPLQFGLQQSGLTSQENVQEDIDAINSVKGEADFAINNAIKYNTAKSVTVLNKAAADLQKKIEGGYKPTQADYDQLNSLKENTYDKLQPQIKTDDELFTQYPTLKKKSVTDAINDFKAITSGNLSSDTPIDKEQIAKLKDAKTSTGNKSLLLKYLKQNGFNTDDQIVQDAIADDRTKDYTWFGGTGQSFLGTFKSAGKSIADLIGVRDDLDRLGEKRLDELMPSRVGKNDRYQLDTFTDLTQQAGRTTGQVLGQGLIQYATGGLGRIAGMSRAAATSTGAWTSGVVTSYDDAYKEAYDFAKNPLQRTTYAGLIAMANAASEKIFNEAKIFELSGVKPVFSEIAQKIGTTGFTDKLANELLDKAKGKVFDFAKKYVKNIGQEVIEEDVTSAFTDITRFIYGDKTASLENALENIKETSIQTALGMTAVAGVGAYRDIQSERNNSNSAMLFNAALYHDEASDAIIKGFEENKYGEAEKNEKFKILNTARKHLSELPITEDLIGRKLNRGEKELYIANLTAQSVIEKQKENSPNEEVKKIADEKINNLKAKQKEILNGNLIVESDGTINTKLSEPIEGIDEQGVPIPGKETNEQKIQSLIKELESITDDNNPRIAEIDAELTALEQQTQSGVATGAKVSEDKNIEKVITGDEITVGEMIDKVGTYKGEKGRFYQDNQAVVFKVDGKNKEYELGNISEIKDTPISDFDITHEKSVVDISDNGNITVRGNEYKNNYSDPLSAINKDADGNIVSVNLETADGKKRTFRGNIAEDIAYQINLKEINKNNETRTEFEQHLNEDAAASKEMDNGTVLETAPKESVENNEPIPREKIEPKVIEVKLAEPIVVSKENTDTNETKEEAQEPIIPTNEGVGTRLRTEDEVKRIKQRNQKLIDNNNKIVELTGKDNAGEALDALGELYRSKVDEANANAKKRYKEGMSIEEKDKIVDEEFEKSGVGEIDRLINHLNDTNDTNSFKTTSLTQEAKDIQKESDEAHTKKVRVKSEQSLSTPKAEPSITPIEEVKGKELGSGGVGGDVKAKNKAFEELVNLIPTTDLRRPNGSIGTQGFSPENLVEVARHIAKEMGFDIPAYDKNKGTSEIKQVIDYLKNNKEAQQKIRDYVVKDPVVVSLLPDNTYEIEDGNHRANLLNLIGVDVIPTIELNGRDKQTAINEHNSKVEAVEQSLKETTKADAKPINENIKSKFKKLKSNADEKKPVIKQAKAVKAIEDKAADAADNKSPEAAAEVIKEIDEIINQTPEQQARNAGQKEIDGTVVKRQEPLQNIVEGKPVDILFTKDDKETGNYAVIERADMQPSHKSGVLNENHFIPEAQPRDRGALEVLKNEAKNKADKLDPNQLADNNIAYFGAPVVNERGEVIQGNGRAEAIDYYYGNDQGDTKGYKEMLKGKAASLGLDGDAIAKMKEPVLVKLTKASDERAIQLGNYTAGELEDVKQRGADVKAAFNRLTPAKVKELSDSIGSKVDETTTLKQIIRDNIKVVLDKLFDLGALRKDNKEQYIRNGEVTPEGIQAAYDIVRQLLFEGGASDLQNKFDELPSRVREAIEKTIPAILGNTELKSKVQEAIEIIREQQESGIDAFATWRIQRDIFGDQKMPADKYDKALLDFAQGLTEAGTQKAIAEKIIKISQAMNGAPATLWDAAVPPKRFDEAYNQTGIKFAISMDGSSDLSQMKAIVKEIQNDYADKDENISLDDIKAIAKNELGSDYDEQLVEQAYHEAGKENRAFKKATAIQNELAKRVQEFTGSETIVLPNSDALKAKAEELQDGVQYNSVPLSTQISEDGIPYLSESTSNTYPTPGDIQREGGSGANNLSVRASWSKLNHIKFDGSTKVKSHADVAFIMRKLENKSVEHGFVVHIDAKGKSHIQFLGIGGITGVVMDTKMILAGVKKFKSVHVTLVHNHPSGNLVPSNADRQMTTKVVNGLKPLGISVDHVIMNTYSKRYTYIDSYDGVEEYERPTETEISRDKSNDKNLTTHILDEFKILDAPLSKVTSSRDAANFIQQLRFSAMPKMGLLLLNQANKIIGNYIFRNQNNLLNEITMFVAESGIGVNVIVYGNSEKKFNATGFNSLKNNLKSLDINLLDFVVTGSDTEAVSQYYKSMADEGLLNETFEKYGTNLPSVTNKVEESNGDVIVDGMGIVSQHSIDITPELRSQVQGGQPLFMKATGGNKEGEIFGFTHDGKIYLNGEHLNPNTPIHEAGHIWVEVAKEKMPLVYKKGIELVNGSMYLKNAKANEFYQAEAAKLPKAERKAYFEHEALAAAIGDKGAQFITEARRKSFIDWAKDLWTKIAEAVGFKGITSKQMENMTLDEFAKRAAVDILKGKEPMKEEAQPEPEPKEKPDKNAPVELSHGGMQDIADAFDLPDVKVRDRVSDIQEMEDAKSTVKQWNDEGKYPEKIDKIINDAIESKGANSLEKVILALHIANVKAEANAIKNIYSKEYDVKVKELERVKRAAEMLKSTAAATTRTNSLLVDADPSMADWMAERKESLEVDELTNVQKEDIKNIWDEYETNLKTADDKITQAEQEVAKLKAELATKTERQKRNYLRSKNQGNLKAERENIIKNIQDKLKKARGETSAKVVPYANELFSIAPDVLKLVTNLIDSGVTKLADIVDNIHGTLVDSIKDITKQDVHNIIAGEYNDKRPTLTELQYAKKDIVEEARLINKLEALQNGEFVKDEKQQRKRNKEIYELRGKIKQYRNYDQSARTPEQILNAIKKRNEARKKEIDEKILNKDYSTKPKPVPIDENKLLKQANPKLWAETMDAINAREESGHKFEKLKYEDELQKRTMLKKWVVDPIGKGITTAKAIKAGIDDSVTMVQLMMAVYSNPRAGFKAKIAAFQDVNNTHFKRRLAALHNSVYWPVIFNSGLDITEPQSFGKKEVEELYSGNLFDDKFRIPFTKLKFNPWTYTGGIFERIFTSMGNNLRLNLFYGRIAMLEGQGKTFESHPEEYKGAARAINELTGRGKVADKLQGSMDAISPIIWAPKMLASTFNTLGVTDLVAAFRGKKGVYREIPPQQARYLGWQMAKGIGMGVAVMAALALRGWGVDRDPRSTTFGNVISPDGNRRYNVFGRFGNLVKTIVQLAGGTKVSSTGNEIDMDKSMGGRGKALIGFWRGKMTPATGIFADYWLNSKTNYFTKQPINLKSLPGDLIAPISFSALTQGLHNDGTMSLLTRFLPELEGIQVSDKRDYKTISTSLSEKSSKFLKDHDISVPYFNPKQIPIKQMKNGVGEMKKLSDFDEATQIKYEKTHSQIFDQELSKLKTSFVFKNAYGNISFSSSNSKDKKIWVKDLTNKDMKEFISLIKEKATEKTKETLFKEYKK